MRNRLVGALVAGLVLVGCGFGPQRSAEVVDDDEVPFQLLDPEAPLLLPQADAPETESVSLCYLGDDQLVEVDDELHRPVDVDDVVAALTELPQDAPRPLRTALGGQFVEDVSVRSGIARVDLRAEVAAVGSDDQLLAVAQLVCTLTARPGIGLVSFSLAGSPVDVPRSDGSLTSSPVSRDDYRDLLP